MTRSPFMVAGVLVALATGTACAGNTSQGGGYEQLRATAEASIDKAASVGGEWRDSRKLLESADKAASEGQLDRAVALAEQAKRQGELGYAQAVSQQ